MLIHILLPQSFVKKAGGGVMALKSYFILKGIHNFSFNRFTREVLLHIATIVLILPS